MAGSAELGAVDLVAVQVDHDLVAVVNEGDRAAERRFRADVADDEADRSAGEPRVGHQRHDDASLTAERGEARGGIEHLRHARRAARPLVAHDDHVVIREPARAPYRARRAGPARPRTRALGRGRHCRPGRPRRRRASGSPRIPATGCHRARAGHRSACRASRPYRPPCRRRVSHPGVWTCCARVSPVQVMTSPLSSPASSSSRTITWTPPTSSMSTMEYLP